MEYSEISLSNLEYSLIFQNILEYSHWQVVPEWYCRMYYFVLVSCTSLLGVKNEISYTRTYLPFKVTSFCQSFMYLHLRFTLFDRCSAKLSSFGYQVLGIIGQHKCLYLSTIIFFPYLGYGCTHIGTKQTCNHHPMLNPSQKVSQIGMKRHGEVMSFWIADTFNYKHTAWERIPFVGCEKCLDLKCYFEKKM